MRESLVISVSALRVISEQMVDSPNKEICGLLAGVGEVASTAIPIPNVARNSLTHFEMDPQSQVDGMILIERSGKELVGIYHSHPPGSLSVPSPIDVKKWAYPEAACVIILAGDGQSVSRIRAFSIRSNHVRSIPIINSVIFE